STASCSSTTRTPSSGPVGLACGRKPIRSRRSMTSPFAGRPDGRRVPEELEGHCFRVSSAGCHVLRGPRHHGHHAGRAGGEAAVGLPGAVRGRPVAGEHAARRDGDAARHLPGVRPGWWWGGLLAGLCFVLPAFFSMLALTIGYAAFGVTPIMRGALYGLGPVVLGIFLVAVYRLGRS